ncbi:MAG: CBS domain-containing protein [Saprospiraceae bacterium]|nr:CBS domain-containing protein [Lewinellaceae bacterium]MBP6810026.1 CBS domain-containing protein [Saprospiraceae bacterium]
MNIFAPISSLMTDHKHLITVAPEDNLTQVKEIFDAHKFHHIPVVHFREIVGIVSRSDFEFFMGGASHYEEDKYVNQLRLERTHVKEIMIKKLGKVAPDDRINVALEIFLINRFHALPVVEDGELVGMLTPYDIMNALSKQVPADSSLVYENKD